EMVMLISAVTDTSVTWLDGTANAHANTAVLSNIAERHTFVIPMSASRARIIYDNTYDGDGTAAEVTTHATVLKVTGV
ncbi:MAG: hypothetical protein KAS32_22745, partial [Candidatus Peribacteraceae bacterium]|nr:hypothetical protein [Candidatus Peribacteraceae bacterium]